MIYFTHKEANNLRKKYILLNITIKRRTIMRKSIKTIAGLTIMSAAISISIRMQIVHKE